jgi:hypothetical protein
MRPSIVFCDDFIGLLGSIVAIPGQLTSETVNRLV